MRSSTRVVFTSSYHLSSINYTSSPFVPTSPFRLRLRNLHSEPPPTKYASNTDRVLCPLGLGVYDRVAPWPLSEADMTMTTYPAAVNLSANPGASYDASVIATVSGINNVFSFILFFFNSSILVLEVNENEWIWTGYPCFWRFCCCQLPPLVEALRGQYISLHNQKRRGGWYASLSSLSRLH